MVSQDQLTVNRDTYEYPGGIPEYLAGHIRSALIRMNPRMKLHRRVYKYAIARTSMDAALRELTIKDILFDTGASHSSYISQQLVDTNRETWKHCIRKVDAEVTLGDNTTRLLITEALVLNLNFTHDIDNASYNADVAMFVINMPNKTIIIGLPDIVASYYYLFIAMMYSVKRDMEDIVKDEKKQIKRDPTQLDAVTLQLPIENLEEPFAPWEDNPWVMSIEEEETPDPCSFTGPLAYLSVTHEEALHNYREMLDKHISPETREDCPKMKEFLLTQQALDVFVPKTWTGIKCPPLDFQINPDMPKHMKPHARPINERIYEPAKKEFDRMCTYFYVKSNSPIASP